MANQNGTYAFRFYIPPDVLLDLMHLPEEFRTLTVAWQEERQAFCFIVEGPHTPHFFVPQNEVLPIHAPAVTKVQDENGDRLTVRFPQFEEVLSAT